MQRQHLRADEVVARPDVGHAERVLALVADELIGGPLPVGVTVGGDLDPDISLALRLSGGDVDLDGPLVAVCDDVVSAGVVEPFYGDLEGRLVCSRLWSLVAARTSSPGFTFTILEFGPAFLLQVISPDRTSVTGLLFGGFLM